MGSYTEDALSGNMTIETNTKYIEELVQASLNLAAPSLSHVKTFSDLGFSSNLQGLEIKCPDGAKYYITIIKVGDKLVTEI